MAIAPTEEVCGNCRSYAPEDYEGQDVGLCRRYPPFPVPGPWGTYPAVHAADWCSEFAKPTAPIGQASSRSQTR